MSNPWDLTDRQAEVMDLLVKTGCNKLIARELDLFLNTVEQHLCRAGRRMDQRNRVLMAVQWDRFRREGIGA